MREYQSLSHTKWNCKYHIVFIPKRRKKVIFGRLRKHLGQLFHELYLTRSLLRIVQRAGILGLKVFLFVP